MKLILQLIFLFLTVAYTLLAYFLNLANPENTLNYLIRPSLLPHQIARQAFFLNKPGDEKYHYAAHSVDEIIIEVDYQSNYPPDGNLNQWLEDMIAETLAKKVQIYLHLDPNIPSVNSHSSTSLSQLVKTTRDYKPQAHQAYLHLVYLSSSADAPSNTGLVTAATDIIIFKQAINELSETDNIISRIEQSTIKHEFGHLLGVDHLQDDNCIMSETVEVYGNNRFQAANIPLDYCFETLRQINNLSPN